LLRLPEGDFDLMIVSLDLQHAEGLRLCSQVGLYCAKRDGRNRVAADAA
jgi:hypothetical protein